jgi:hypothetical protein
MRRATVPSSTWPIWLSVVPSPGISTGRPSSSRWNMRCSRSAPGGFWARRGLRLERPSEDFGTVVTQAPVARFDRTPAVAGDTPRIFGQGQPDGWTK